MKTLYLLICYQPILNILMVLYNYFSFKDFGIAIILLTVVIKLILWPLSNKAIKSQKEMQDIQPKIEELKHKFGDNKEELAKATMELYKDKKINPFSSCLTLLIQLPFLFAVYRVVRDGLSKDLSLVYSFIPRPEIINLTSLGFLDLNKPNFYLAILAGLAQFVQTKMMLNKQKKAAGTVATGKEENMTQIMNKQMTYMFPAITVIIGISLPGGLTLYWFMFTLLTIFQQLIVIKKVDKENPIEGQIIK
jgi:YidC/Oxa1 family membrane protein insertase